MEDMMLWVGWYVMLVTFPFVVTGLLMKEWVANAAPQRVRNHRW
ncbi:MAG: hypothetical protein LZF86_70017 [Nitrospira sp.]|nr:MAG: hypothetical protein LZF86_70017 [Nitrospira sp.]